MAQKNQKTEERLERRLARIEELLLARTDSVNPSEREIQFVTSTDL